MSYSNNAIENSLKIIWPIVFVGGGLGLLLSWLVLSGDQQGRVNLFYLLLVYLVIPFLSIVASVISLFFGKGLNLARLITSMPIMSSKLQSLIRKIQQLKMDKYWFLLQSQVAAIAFSVASLFVFFTLLIATDINFVWRSTILEPQNILPLLETVSWPWSFWIAAQPNLELLELTQDFRLLSADNSFSGHGAWWKFILATQIFYSLSLRIILMLYTRWWLARSLSSDLESTLQQKIKSHKAVKKESHELFAAVEHIPESIRITNWDGVPIEILTLLNHINLSSDNILIDGWQGTLEQQKLVDQWHEEQLVIVKAWEGPLGELEDFLANKNGYILPIDWNDSGLIKPELHHFQEWQRLTSQLPNWKLYCPFELMPVELKPA